MEKVTCQKCKHIFEIERDLDRADLVFTDPPYNVNIKGSGKNTSNTILNDNMSKEAFQTFLVESFREMAYAAVKKGAAWFVFHAEKTAATFEEALRIIGYEVRATLVWNKPSAGMGMNEYRSKHEPFFYAAIKDVKPKFYGDRTNSTVIDFQKSPEQLIAWAKKQKKLESEGKTTIWTMKREPTQSYLHTTQKPVELVTYALFNHTKEGDVVLDPFLGSGTTLIACEKTGRVCYGVELDLHYCDTIIERWENYAGKKAKKVIK